MHTFLKLAIIGAFAASSASAAYITMSVGFNNSVNQGILVSSVDLINPDDSVEFSGSLPIQFNLGACSNMLLCGAPVETNTATFTSGVLHVFTFAGMTYETDSVWFVEISGTPGNLTFAIKTTGLYKAPGYDDTPGVLNFTFQEPESGGVYTFSASGTTVPEPASMVLMGAGLAGLGLWARRRRR